MLPAVIGEVHGPAALHCQRCYTFFEDLRVQVSLDIPSQRRDGVAGMLSYPECRIWIWLANERASKLAVAAGLANGL
jgi:hypothetical protein